MLEITTPSEIIYAKNKQNQFERIPAMTEHPIIEISNLNFSYSKKDHTLKNLNLSIPEGSIYGFLGPNGAGKSTTMQILTDILTGYEGEVKVFGASLKSQTPEIFKRIGALVESPSLYLHLSGYDNLKYITRLKQLEENEIEPILKLVGLEGKGGLKVKKYSLGMKQRLAIGMTLLGNPDILFLDEPVNGLDPMGMTEVRELLVRINKELGTTIFISSHLLAEIEKMCTHIAIIHHGEKKFEGTMEQLKQLNKKGFQVIIETNDARAAYNLLNFKYSKIEIKNQSELIVPLERKEDIPAFIAHCVELQMPLFSVSSKEDLEDWFLKLTK
ncbi:MAG: ABC transporter ATP-binding protein [Nonlabens sp.]